MADGQTTSEKASAIRIVNRITVADVMKGAKQQRLWKASDPEVEEGKYKAGDLRFDAEGKPVMGPVDKTNEQRLYVIRGKARESKSGETQYGIYREYFGPFEAVRLCDGVIFRGNRCIFPPPTDAVVAEVFDAEKKADKTAEVAFAFIIGSQEHRHGEEVKYKFTCEPLDLGSLAPEATDPLAVIKAATEAQLGEMLQLVAPPQSPQLEAPKEEPKGGKKKT